jgi:hypothetical protein
MTSYNIQVVNWCYVPQFLLWVCMCLNVCISGNGFLKSKAADWSAPFQIGTLTPPCRQEIQLSAITNSFCSLKSQCSFVGKQELLGCPVLDVVQRQFSGKYFVAATSEVCVCQQDCVFDY